MMIRKCFISVLIALLITLSVAVVVSAEPTGGGGWPPSPGPRGRIIMLYEETVESPALPPVCVYPTEDEAE